VSCTRNIYNACTGAGDPHLGQLQYLSTVDSKSSTYMCTHNIARDVHHCVESVKCMVLASYDRCDPVELWGMKQAP
jgi:hypothetical protein